MLKILLSGCLLMLLIAAPASAQDEMIPYIHYFSPLDDGLVIERADGADSRLIPDVGDGVPNWSPSGAWMVIDHRTIIRTDGTRRAAFPQATELMSSGDTQWAPEDDLLLIVGEDYRDGTVRSQIYDVEAEQVIAEIALQYFALDPPSFYHLHWTADGEQALIHWRNHLVTLHRDGTSKVQINWLDWPFEFHRGRLLHRNLTEGDSPFSNDFVIEDAETNRQMVIGDEAGWPSAPATVRWSSTRDHALIYARNCPEEDCTSSLRLVNWQTGDVQEISPNVAIQPDFPEKYCYYLHECMELWSPNGRFAALTDSDGAVHVLDVETGQAHPIGKYSFYNWSPDETLFTPHPDGLLRYDPLTGQTTEFAWSGHSYAPDRLQPSPDGKLIGLHTNPPMIVDLNDVDFTQTGTNSHRLGELRFPTSGYTWHEAHEWVMANYTVVIAGGGGGPVASVLFNLKDETVRRELPTGGNAGFLPNRAIPHLQPGQPSSVKKEPIAMLRQTGQINGVTWHPEDSDRLVTYSEEDGMVFWSFAGDEPEIIGQTTLRQPFPQPDSGSSGLLLFWLPEQNIVAFLQGNMLYYQDEQTGEARPVESVSYPIWSERNEVFSIRYSQSGIVRQLNTSEFTPGYPRFLTPNLRGFIVHSREIWAGQPSIHYIDALTGNTALLSEGGVAHAADANAGIAALANTYDCCITVVSIATGQVIDEFYATAHSLALSADGRRLATAALDMTNIWDVSEYLAAVADEDEAE
jgi:WD40 repeat protein